MPRKQRHFLLYKWPIIPYLPKLSSCLACRIIEKKHQYDRKRMIAVLLFNKHTLRIVNTPSVFRRPFFRRAVLALWDLEVQCAKWSAYFRLGVCNSENLWNTRCLVRTIHGRKTTAYYESKEPYQNRGFIVCNQAFSILIVEHSIFQMQLWPTVLRPMT